MRRRGRRESAQGEGQGEEEVYRMIVLKQVGVLSLDRALPSINPTRAK